MEETRRAEERGTHPMGGGKGRRRWMRECGTRGHHQVEFVTVTAAVLLVQVPSL